MTNSFYMAVMVDIMAILFMKICKTHYFRIDGLIIMNIIIN